MARPSLGSPACLPRVNVAPDRLIRTLVGLRPYRPSGFVVRADALGDKRLVHNYGHGGSGITLSWGTSRLATNMGLPGHSGPVAVIGAGVVGLTTARLVQEAGYPVTIYAKALPPDTTSNIAGGQWYPSILYRQSRITPAFETQLVAAASYAYQRFQIMIGEEYGVRWMTNYELADDPFGQSRKDRLLQSMLPETKTLGRGQHSFGAKYVRQFDGMLIEPPRFLRAMLRDVRIAGRQDRGARFRVATRNHGAPRKPGVQLHRTGRGRTVRRYRIAADARAACGAVAAARGRLCL